MIFTLRMSRQGHLLVLIHFIRIIIIIVHRRCLIRNLIFHYLRFFITVVFIIVVFPTLCSTIFISVPFYTSAVQVIPSMLKPLNFYPIIPPYNHQLFFVASILHSPYSVISLFFCILLLVSEGILQPRLCCACRLVGRYFWPLPSVFEDARRWEHTFQFLEWTPSSLHKAILLHLHARSKHPFQLPN